MSGVGIVCFAASYAIALGLEISRIFFRSSVRNVFILGWVLAGLTAHTAYLYYRNSIALVPITGAESYFIVSAWGMVLVYLCLSCFHPKTPFGLVVLPIVLLLIGGGVLTGSVADPPKIASTLKNFHTATFFFATLYFIIGFIAGLTYFVQDRRLRCKEPVPNNVNIPSIEWSLTIARGSLGAATVALIISVLSGLALSGLPNQRIPFLTDPLVLGTMLLIAFLMFSGILSGKLQKKAGRQIAWVTVFGFLLLVIMLLLGILFTHAHWNRTQGIRESITTFTVAQNPFFHGKHGGHGKFFSDDRKEVRP